MKLGGLSQQHYTITEWITRVFTANMIWLSSTKHSIYLQLMTQLVSGENWGGNVKA
ncbi:hypothetical protein RKD52_000649 [Metabacillus sp. SLBN-84]